MKASLTYGDTKPGNLVGPAGWSIPIGWQIKDNGSVPPEYEKERSAYQDPKCSKCGIVLGNKMMYVCPHSYCPSGLN